MSRNSYTKSGTRGGRDQFNWESVKEDKHRESYLGHSLLAPVGRWQQGRDLNWYSKDGKDGEITAADARAEEIATIKQQEADMLAEALGVKPKGPRKATVTDAELKHTIGKNMEEDASYADPQPGADRVKGVGFRESRQFISTILPVNGGGKSISEGLNHHATSSNSIASLVAPRVIGRSASPSPEPHEARPSKERHHSKRSTHRHRHGPYSSSSKRSSSKDRSSRRHSSRERSSRDRHSSRDHHSSHHRSSRSSHKDRSSK